MTQLKPALPRVTLKKQQSVVQNQTTPVFILKKALFQDKNLVASLRALPVDATLSQELVELLAISLVHVFAVNSQLKEGLHKEPNHV